MKNDIVVNSWLDLQNLIFDDSWDETIKRYRSPYVAMHFATSNLERYNLDGVI